MISFFYKMREREREREFEFTREFRRKAVMGGCLLIWAFFIITVYISHRGIFFKAFWRIFRGFGGFQMKREKLKVKKGRPCSRAFFSFHSSFFSCYAGISWGISGNLAKTKAQEESLETIIETERMFCILNGLKAIKNRITEGENLLYALSGKLKKSLDNLQSLALKDGELSDEAAKEIDASIRLIKSLKQVIETDICNADGFLTKRSGVIFRKIEQEVKDV